MGVKGAINPEKLKLLRGSKSEFTKKNPWKNWPAYIPCFCGCGKKTKLCPSIKLMPKWIAPKDFDEASKDYQDKLIYVQGLLRKGEVYKDVEHSNRLAKIFMERDKTIENATYRENGVQRGVGGDTPLNNNDGAGSDGPSAPKLSGENPGSSDGGAA
jgi:hypothetical protein